jgi:hypothetical protein
MARVVTGTIEIPGEKLSEYLQAVEDAEQAKAPFRKHLEQLNREFERYVLQEDSSEPCVYHRTVY